MKITFGISEVFAIGSIYLYQSAFTFSMVLLALALVSKLFSYATELEEKRKKAEVGGEMMVNLTDSLMSAIQLKSFGNEKNGYH